MTPRSSNEYPWTLRSGWQALANPPQEVAKIDSHKPGAPYIYRENNRRYIPIKFSVQGRDLASTIAEAKKKVKDPQHGANLPNGYDIDWSGEFKQMEEANGRLLWIVPISIGLIMVLLYSAFSSIKDSLLVMVNVIEASMGGILALGSRVRRSPFWLPWASCRSSEWPSRMVCS